MYTVLQYTDIYVMLHRYLLAYMLNIIIKVENP